MARKPMKFAQPKFPNGTRVRAFMNVFDVSGAVIRQELGCGNVIAQLGEQTVEVEFFHGRTRPVMESNLETLDGE